MIRNSASPPRATRNNSRSKRRNGAHKACPTKKIKKTANNTPRTVPANLLPPRMLPGHLPEIDKLLLCRIEGIDSIIYQIRLRGIIKQPAGRQAIPVCISQGLGFVKPVIPNMSSKLPDASLESPGQPSGHEVASDHCFMPYYMREVTETCQPYPVCSRCIF